MYFNKMILTAVFALSYFQQTSNIARAEERYYMLIFASQGERNLPHLAHTFATFVKTDEKDQGGKEFKATHTISWLPKDLSVELGRITPVRGVNLSLDESITLAQLMKTRVTVWGPVPVKKAFYDMAVAQAGRLSRGEISYIVLDRRWRGQGASNCFHAVSDLDTTQPALDTGSSFGDAASEMVFRHFARHTISSPDSLRWINDKLDLKPSVVRFATPEVAPPVLATSEPIPPTLADR